MSSHTSMAPSSSASSSSGRPVPTAFGSATAATAPDASTSAAGALAERRARFVQAMGANSTSVHVVTTRGTAPGAAPASASAAQAPAPLGLTVSACSSVSADPPTILVCIHSKNLIAEAIVQQGAFAVNLLNADQRHIADTFAGRPANNGTPFDFGCCGWRAGELDVPLIDDAVASLECRLSAAQRVGSHWVFFGEVQSVHTSADAPLLYCQRSYGRFQQF